VQVDSFHRSNTAKWKAGKTASSVQVHGLVQGREWQAVQTASQIADAKTSAKSQYLGVVETAQASSAVEGLNGQRPHCPGIGSPVETSAQAGGEAEMKGMRRKSGR
jgi:hypothetical protein